MNQISSIWRQSLLSLTVLLTLLPGLSWTLPQYHDLVVLSHPLNHPLNQPGKQQEPTTHSSADTRGLNISNRSASSSDTFSFSSFSFSSMGRDFTLELRPSHATRTTTIHRTNNQLSYPDNLRVLEGTVTGDPSSWVRVVEQAGVVTGHVKTFGILYEIAEAYPLGLQDKSETVMFESRFSGRALLEPHLFEIDPIAHAPTDKSADSRTSETESAGALNPATGVHTAVRVGVVIDSRFDEYHNQRGLARALSIINTVDGIYQEQLGVAVILESLVSYDDPATDPMRDVTGPIDDILVAFRDVRRAETALPADLTMVHFLSGLRDPQNVIGLGWIGTACRTDGYDVSMSTPFAFDGLLSAHEMAHNLGALHDNQTSCPSQSHDIMKPSLSALTTATFSNCSQQAMTSGVNASCNVDNIDLAMSLAVMQTDTELQYRLSAMVTNTDASRDVDTVSSLIRLPAGTVATFQDSRCAWESEGILCFHGSVKAQSTDTINMLITYPDRWEQTIIADILPTGFTDVAILNNRATLQTTPSVTDSGGAVFNPEPVAIASDDPVPTSGGAGQLLLLLPALLYFRSRRRR